VVATGSSTGVTIATANGCTTDLWMNLTEWSGLSGTLDQAANTNGTGTPATASITTLNANDLVIFGVSETATSGIGTLGAPWTAMTTVSDAAGSQSSWYQLVSSTGSFNPSVSVTASWDAAIAAFNVATTPTVSAPVDDGAGHLYIGGSDGKVHELDIATGADHPSTNPAIPGAPTVGAPAFDVNLNRIYVGASDGHIYSFTTPW
jgi:hypothetical protein